FTLRATHEIYSLSLHDALPIYVRGGDRVSVLILTDGVTSHHPVTEPQKAAARAACRALGVHEVRFVDLPDQRLDSVPLLDIIRRSEEHTSELQSPCNLVCRLLL